MLPDGTINPGQMTSFNHYALGSVAHFLHGVVGGLSPLEPGWKKALIKPQPGGTITSAKTTFDSPYGPYSVEWILSGTKLSVKASVPPNASAKVELAGVEETIGSGRYEWQVEWKGSGKWPPKQLQGPAKVEWPDQFIP
jgi:alpha-L-rhamnosidase